MIVVTGATGQLGRLVIEKLLETIPANRIVAAVRNPDRASDMAALGVDVRRADYAKPETLSAAFAGADRLLLVSSNNLGQRLAEHCAVVDAAVSVGVKLLAYTSILRADTSTMALAAEHKSTEEYISKSGIPFVFLRNGWYFENHTRLLGHAIGTGAIVGAAGHGHFASAACSDYAAAAAAVMTTAGHENKTYELAGNAPYTYYELAELVSQISGKHVSYNDSAEALQQSYLSFGVPSAIATIIVDADLGAAKGELDSTSRDLETLIGRPTSSLKDAVNRALGSATAGAH